MRLVAMMMKPRYPARFSVLFTCVLFVACVLLVACGDDSAGGGDQNNGVFVPNNGTSGLDGGARPDGGAVPDGGEGSDGGEGPDGSEDRPGRSCVSPPEDLGELTLGDEVSLDREFHRREEPSRVSCTEPESGAGIYWFKFTVPEVVYIDAEIRASLSASPTIELLSGSCGAGSQDLFCLPVDNFRRVLEPGVTYFLIVQGHQDTGGAQFSFSYTLEPAVCAPGLGACSSGAIDYCDDGEELVERQCIGECLDEVSCEADRCDSAEQVDVSTLSSPKTIIGDQMVYHHRWDADDRLGCSTAGDGGAGGSSLGIDSFLQLSGVQSGDTISFDASSSDTSLAFYVLDACDAEQCITAGGLNDVGDNVFSWTSSSAGEYFVVVEALGRTEDSSFTFTIDHQAAVP